MSNAPRSLIGPGSVGKSPSGIEAPFAGRVSRLKSLRWSSLMPPTFIAAFELRIRSTWE